MKSSFLVSSVVSSPWSVGLGLAQVNSDSAHIELNNGAR